MALAPRARQQSARTLLEGALSESLQWQGKPPRYRSTRTGRYLSPQVVRGVVDAEIDLGKLRIKRAGLQLQLGDIDLNQWRDTMATEIKTLFLMQTAAAKGGFKNLTAADYKNVSNQLKRQFRYLERFARQIDKDPSKAMSADFLRRSGLYGEASREAYEEAHRQANIDAGMKSERNRTHSLESCEAAHGRPGCADLEFLGWVPIGTTPAVGRRACFTGCKCTLEYSEEEPP